jgi:hypothetical protein
MTCQLRTVGLDAELTALFSPGHCCIPRSRRLTVGGREDSSALSGIELHQLGDCAGLPYRSRRDFLQFYLGIPNLHPTGIRGDPDELVGACRGWGGFDADQSVAGLGTDAGRCRDRRTDELRWRWRHVDAVSVIDINFGRRSARAQTVLCAAHARRPPRATSRPGPM